MRKVISLNIYDIQAILFEYMKASGKISDNYSVVAHWKTDGTLNGTTLDFIEKA